MRDIPTRSQQVLPLFRSRFVSALQFVVLLFWTLNPWPTARGIYYPDEQNNPQWLQLNPNEQVPQEGPDVDDSNQNGIVDWLDDFFAALNDDTISYWQGGSFMVGGQWTSYYGQYLPGDLYDSDMDGIPDAIDPYYLDASNSSFYWAGGEYTINGEIVTFPPQYFSGTWLDTDGDGIPDVVDPVNDSGGGNNDGSVAWWDGGMFIVDGNLITYLGCWYAMWSSDMDSDGIPEVIDPYPGDGSNNSFWWDGGTFYVNEATVTFGAQYYEGHLLDSDEDGIPDALDSYAFDGTNNNEQRWWAGGQFTIDSTVSTFEGRNYYGSPLDGDQDGIPDAFDPYPDDSYNNTFFEWQGGWFMISGSDAFYSPGMYWGLWVDSDIDMIPDPADPYPQDATNNSIWWAGGAGWNDGVYEYYSSRFVPGDGGDSDGDGIPDTVDPFPGDPTNNTVNWPGGEFRINAVLEVVSGRSVSAYAPDSDYDGMPDSADPYPSDASNNSTWWEGGSFIIGSQLQVFEAQWHCTYSLTTYNNDTDWDTIPDDLDLYINDPQNNSTFYWEGGEFYQAGQLYSYSAGDYYGILADDDADGLPAAIDFDDQDSTNDTEWWEGGVFRVDRMDVTLEARWHRTSSPDSDEDGLPDDVDPYAEDAMNGNRYTWPSESAVFTMNNTPVSFVPALYDEPYVDSDADTIPDPVDWYPNDATNNNDSNSDGIPDWVMIAFELEESTFDADSPRVLSGQTDGLSWRVAYQHGVLDVLLQSTTDSDGDEMTDLYEITHHLQRLNPADAADVPAGDFIFNQEKAKLGMPPTEVVPAQDYFGITGHPLVEVTVHHNPELSAAENDWDGDGISNVDELITFGTNARLATSAPGLAHVLVVLLQGRGSLTTRLNYLWLMDAAEMAKRQNAVVSNETLTMPPSSTSVNSGGALTDFQQVVPEALDAGSAPSFEWLQGGNVFARTGRSYQSGPPIRAHWQWQRSWVKITGYDHTTGGPNVWTPDSVSGSHICRLTNHTTVQNGAGIGAKYPYFGTGFAEGLPVRPEDLSNLYSLQLAAYDIGANEEGYTTFQNFALGESSRMTSSLAFEWPGGAPDDYVLTYEIVRFDGNGVEQSDVTRQYATFHKGDTLTNTVQITPGHHEWLSLRIVRDAPRWHLSVHDAAGASHRKVGLNGAPMPDSPPENAVESDEPDEETYIDAFNGRLQHRTSDVYVPLGASQLRLEVTRHYESEIWSRQFGFRPNERLDRPFGASWGSNLCSYMKIDSDWGSGFEDWPGDITVVDECGQTREFIGAVSEGDGVTRYLPKRNQKLGAKASHDKFTKEPIPGMPGKWQFVLRKKFGTTCYFPDPWDFSNPRVVEPKATDRYLEGPPVLTTTGRGSTPTSYSRLTRVTDAWNNEIKYEYPSDTTLIPNKIWDAKRPGQVIWIKQDNRGLVTDVQAPGGERTHYTYDDIRPYTFSVLENVWTLSSVTRNGGTARYGYDMAREEDPTPTNDEPWTSTYHADLNRIEDENGESYTFDIEFDHSQEFIDRDEAGSPTTRSQTGVPRRVKTVHRPDNSVVNLVLHRELRVTEGKAIHANGGCLTHITGPAGAFTYTFSNPHLWQAAPDYAPLLYVPSDVTQSRPLTAFNHDELAAALRNRSLVVYYTDMSVAGPEGTEEFKFDFDAGMAIKSVNDMYDNTTKYYYDDFNTEAQNPGWNIVVVGYGDQPIETLTQPAFDSRFDDPTRVTNALEKTTENVYDPDTRLLTETITPRGVRHWKTYDSMRRLTASGVRDEYDVEASRTTLAYTDANFPGFTTRQTLHKALDFEEYGGEDLVTAFTPDPWGKVQDQIVDPDGLALTTTTAYDLQGRKRAVKDPNGNVTEFVYVNGRLHTVRNPDQSTKELRYDPHGNLTSETNELGHQVTHLYDEFNRRTRTDVSFGVNPAGGPSSAHKSMSYNVFGQVLTETDLNGNQTTHTYDGIGRRETTSIGSRLTTFTYGTNSGSGIFNVGGFKPTMIEDPNHNRKHVEYDALYRPWKQWVVSAAPESESYGYHFTEYDDDGNARLTTDPFERTTETEYDALNRPIRTTYFDETFTETAYTPSGKVWKKVDELSRASHLYYDRADRLVETKGPAVDGVHPVSRQAYDANSNVIGAMDPTGAVVLTEYDSRNRPFRIQAPKVYDMRTDSWRIPVTETTYDAAGNVKVVKDPFKFATLKDYDLANRPIKITDPLGRSSTMSYDANGNVLTTTDTNGNKVTNTYTVFNELKTTTDDTGSKTEFTYDGNGNRRTVKDGNLHTTTFDYDGLNRVLKESYPEARTVSHTYDEMRKLTTTTGAGRTLTYGYDDRDRMTRVDFTGGGRTYEYDDVGQLESVTEDNHPEADVAYTYDDLGRVMTETSRGLTHEYEYDLAGRRTRTVLGGTGRETINVYDGGGRLMARSEDSRTTWFYYDLAGRAVGQWLPNNQFTSNYIDVLGRLVRRSVHLVSIENPGTSTLCTDFVWRHDNVGNVTFQSEYWTGATGRTPGTRTTVMEYDEANRLDQERITEPDDVVTVTDYDYDDAGNRTVKTVSDDTVEIQKRTEYDYNDLNQLTAWREEDGDTEPLRSADIDYDDAGNRISQVVTPTGGSALTTTYSWTKQNLLESVTVPDGTVHSYGYDYRVRRISRTEGTQSTAMVFSGGLSVSEYGVSNVGDEIVPTAAPEVEYQRGPDMGGGVGGLLYSLRNGVVRFNLSNSRGDVVAQSDSTGAITWTASYEAYGKRTIETGTNADRQRANTKDEDPTGLLNEGFRYRDIETGVWLSADPAGFVDGPNLYAYVKQNPWSKFDALGLFDDGLAHGMYFVQRPEHEAAYIDGLMNGCVMGAKAVGVFIWNLIPGIGENNDLNEAEKHPAGSRERALYNASAMLGMSTGGVWPNRSGVRATLQVIADSTEADAVRGAREAAKGLNEVGEKSSKKIAEEASEQTDRLAKTAPQRSIAADNYRGRYNAERHSQGLSRLPDDYDAHHRIPQEYMNHPDFKNFDFHSPNNIQGVKGSRADVNVHQDITNDWAQFRKDNPTANGEQISGFATQIDTRYKEHWFK